MGNTGSTPKDSFKVLVVGARGVGKSSVVDRWTNKRFTGTYQPTVGVDFGSGATVRDGTTVTFELWDLSWTFTPSPSSLSCGRLSTSVCTSSCTFSCTHPNSTLTGYYTNRQFYDGAAGIVGVCDVTDPSTLVTVEKWVLDRRKTVGNKIPVVLMANKCDTVEEDEEVSTQLDSFCYNNGIARWFSSSAKDDVNVEEAFDFLADQLMKNENAKSSTT